MKRTEKWLLASCGVLLSVVAQGVIVDLGAAEVAEAATEVKLSEGAWQIDEAVAGYAGSVEAGSWQSGVVRLEVGMECASGYCWEDQPLGVVERLGEKSSGQLEQLGEAVRRVGHYLVREVEAEIAGSRGREETLSSIVAVPESSLTVWAALLLVLALPLSVLLRRGERMD
jgi:hypothetical protein